MLSEKLDRGTKLVHRWGTLPRPHTLTSRGALQAPLLQPKSPTPMTPRALSWWMLPMASMS